ncbi:ki-ras-induced actin-interacting protein-IP3R-interacting domain olf186-M isoform X2 [Ptiloglossa arizonensis]|uniref:ki-ras-induced actin-interacting protein-IP3R-interacting domain olf186-M isoform X2 n=1 Tax=Ptiloglossa arizonensis TaxID=3350558 RepID=UPI003FA01EE8
MRRRTGPVQQWVDSIPSPIKTNLSVPDEHNEVLTKKLVTPLTSTEPKDILHPMGTKLPTMTVSAPINVPTTSTINTSGLPSSLPHKLVRDPSLQSDSSHCSSVESLLELRKADPEAILLGLGFGGCSNSPKENCSLSRIPKRFLQPSKLKGIAINEFMKHQQETSESIDSVSLGYRGLTGSPYVAPSEIVQKIMQRLREHESHEYDPYAMYNSYEQYSPLQYNGTLSVLSPDNRQFLERPRSKSPDMRNKRMIIGQKSFAFGNNGDLIEINPSDVKGSSEGNVSNDLNIKENSKIYRNLEDTDTNYDKISNNISIQEIQTCKEQLNKENTNLDKNINFEEDISFNQTTQNLSDIRRASDGSCDVKFGENLSIVWGRRHSDSFVQTIGNGNGESILSQRRKTLKRQTRVTDTDAISYCNSKASISDTIQSKEVNLHKKVEIGEHSTNIQVNSLQKIAENTALRTEDESCGAKCLNTFSEGTNDYIQCLDNSLVKEKRQQDNDKCYVEKNQSLEQTFVDEEESTTCCCSGTTKYWEKMDKIIQENKNLENMVAKNTREMAEIREMLSNVLSVRLEPGF